MTPWGIAIREREPRRPAPPPLVPVDPPVYTPPVRAPRFVRPARAREPVELVAKNPPHPLHRFLLAVPALCFLLTGCASWSVPFASDWMADYDRAERQQSDSGKQVLFFFKDERRPRNKSIREALADPQVKTLIEPYLKCTLAQEYEPDRRYARQFGVERGPALILLDSDGMYRARSGPMTTDKVRAFLQDADAPRLPAVRNPHLHHEVRYDWSSDLEAVEARAQRTGRPILIVLFHEFSREFEKLREQLDEPPVFRQFRNHEHCKLGVVWGSRRAVRERFHVRDLPALVVVSPEGDSRVLEKPISARAIVRFARANAEGEATQDASAVVEGR